MAKRKDTLSCEIVTLEAARSQGLVRFYTGNPCKRGHIAERYTRTPGCCVECGRNRQNKNNRENPEPGRQRAREWRSSNRKRHRASVREWQKENPDRVKESRRKTYSKLDPSVRLAKKNSSKAKKPDYYREQAKAYRQRNRERIAEYERSKRLADPESFRVRVRNRRAKRRQAEGSHTAAEVKSLLKRQRNRCASTDCRKSLAKGYHADHITSLHCGGTNYISNIQLLCSSCNQSKWAKDPIVWARENGLLV